MKCESCGWDIAFPKDTTIRYGVGSKQLMGCYPITESKERPVEDKSWNEFIDYANSQLADHLGRSHPDMYYESKEFNKIGLLIVYLKSKDFHNKDVKFCIKEFTLENLESEVKSLKPKEDDEVEELANELYLSGGGSGKLTTPGGIEYWETIARKAIEIVKGKA